MVVYRHKKSTKWFICIDETGNNEALFVTPEDDSGKVRIISIAFEKFDGEKEADEESLLSEGIISVAQLSRFKIYKEDRRVEDVENIKHNFTPSQIKQLIKELEEMNNNENPDE